MLSKKNKKRVAKAKRTTKKYLTKWGIRKPKRNPDLNIDDYINQEVSVIIEKPFYSVSIKGYLQYYSHENKYLVRDASSNIIFSIDAIFSLTYKESVELLIIILK